MLNKIILLGRLTRDFEERTTQEGMVIARGSIAVNRMKKDEADFINLVAFGKTAENLGKYFRKGSKIALEGRLQTGNYTNKDGVKVYTADVVVENFDFVDSKDTQNTPTTPVEAPTSDFMYVSEEIDAELPFASHTR